MSARGCDVNVLARCISLLCSIWWPRAPAAAALALRSGDLVLSPCAGCVGSKMANFHQIVCAIAEWDACVAGGDPYALGEIRTGQCRILGGVAAQTIAVAAKMELCARCRPICKIES